MSDSMWLRGLDAKIGGSGVVQHSGMALLRLMSHRSGLRAGLSQALARRGFIPLHDRGQVVTDLSVTVAGGGTHVSDLAVLHHSREVFGPVASAPTGHRVLREMTGPVLKRIDKARAKARRWAWAQIVERHGQIPESRIGGGAGLGKTIVIRLDATLLNVHSEKEGAERTFKKGFGFHPLTGWCDNTEEFLQVMLRPGNAGSNTAADHTKVVDGCIAQLPPAFRRDLLFTCDGAGATGDLIRHLTKLEDRRGFTVHYSVGWDLSARERAAISLVPTGSWTQVLDSGGRPRDLEEAGVVELTGLLRESAGGDQLKNWPAGMRVLARREKPSSSAIASGQLSLFELGQGWRYQLFATNTPGRTVQFLEARHRPHARVEARIRCAKAAGLGKLPSADYAVNTAWAQAIATIAADLTAWTQLLGLDGEQARAEPKKLRHQILHTAALLTRRARKRWLNINPDWPWASQWITAFQTIKNLPQAVP